MILSEQMSLQERTSQEPTQEPQVQTKDMELKWVKCNVHRSVQQKLCNASRDEKDVMCKMRISTFKMPCARCAYRFQVLQVAKCKLHIEG